MRGIVMLVQTENLIQFNSSTEHTTEVRVSIATPYEYLKSCSNTHIYSLLQSGDKVESGYNKHDKQNMQ
jgi:hypothetical protein